MSDRWIKTEEGRRERPQKHERDLRKPKMGFVKKDNCFDDEEKEDLDNLGLTAAQIRSIR